jgi:hypothetical protein
VNGDGKPDLVVTNYCVSSDCATGGNVGVLLGNGDGTFQPAVSYEPGGYSAESVAVADLNGDGKPDLVVANNDCSVGVLLGNGDGTFRGAVSYGSGGSGCGFANNSVAVRDVNGDGKLDLLVASPSCSGVCGQVGVLLGNGDGTFQTAVSYPTEYESDSVAVADVNGDGKPDLLVANYCDLEAGCWDQYVGPASVSVLLGNGDGTFRAAVSYEAGGYDAESVAVADLNSDGKPDLVVTDSSGVSVLLGNGDGTFQAAVSYGAGGFESLSVAVADVNGDGKLDLVGTDGSGVSVLLGKGDGTFQAAVSYSAGGYEALSVAVADVNGDGKLDLVVGNESISGLDAPGGVGVLLGNGDGTFQPTVSYSLIAYEAPASSVAVADVNGDGKPDLVVADYISGVCVLLGNGNGTFQTAVCYGSGKYAAYSVAVADVNGDGKLDLLVADGSGVSVALGNGDGTFQAAVSYSAGGYGADFVAVADVNGDGKPDLLVANDCISSSNCTNGTVGVLLGNGDGTFQPAVSYGSGGYEADFIAVADVNGDGKLDLLVANYCVSSDCTTGGSVGVLLGNGYGTFQPANAFVTPGPNKALAVGDFNGDGKVDIASGYADALLLGNGDGTFQSPLTLGASGWGIAVGDFNRDGRPDLAVGGVSGVPVLLNIATNFHYATTTVVTSSLNPAPPCVSVTFTAAVTPAFNAGALTGGVTFYDGIQALGTVAISNGQAAFSTSSLSLGTHSITASYAGDTNYLPSTSPVLSQMVQGAVPVFSPPNLNFGNQTVGIASGQQVSTLSNMGNITLGITSIIITGTNSSDFTQTNNCGTSVLAGGSCNITVTFTPTATGTGAAAVSISDNALGSPQALALSGVGVLPAVTLSPSRITFATQVVFTSSKPETVALTNTGAGILNITKIAATGQFGQTSTCGSTLAPGANCTITVTFKPTAKGTLTGSISITDNAPGSPQKVPLTGTGTYVQLNPTSVNFGTQPVGTQSLPKRIALTNKGSVAVSISGIAITGTDPGDFAQTNTCGKSVAAGGSCFIEVTFKPLVKGKRNADVSISDNGGGSPQTVSLTGTGT